MYIRLRHIVQIHVAHLNQKQLKLIKDETNAKTTQLTVPLNVIAILLLPGPFFDVMFIFELKSSSLYSSSFVQKTSDLALITLKSCPFIWSGV